MRTVAVREAEYGLAVALGDVLRSHGWYIAIVAAYCMASILAGLLYSDANPPALTLYSESFALVAAAFAASFLIGHAIYVMVFVRPEKLLQTIVRDLRETYLSPIRLLHALPVLLLFPLFISAYTSFKTLIPVINPYGWDIALAEVDRVLHGGLHPWQLLHPVIGHPPVTWAINAVYHLWFFVLFGLLFWQAFCLRDRLLRMQFLLSFLLVWCVAGTLAAVYLSSAGPVYYGRITGAEDIYQPLMAYLQEVNEVWPVPALSVQEMLWSAYDGGTSGLGSGISAMPSMHMATAFLFALLGWRSHRVLGIALSVFALFIFLGSVHLGWHYAIDSYLAIAIAAAIWLAVGAVLKRRWAAAAPLPA